MNLQDLKELKPCNEGLEFVKNSKSLLDAWNTCERGDWMLWIAKRLGCDLQTLTLAKGLCAKTVYKLMKDNRSRKAVRVAIAFGLGKATIEELKVTAADAYAAYAAAAVAYEASAAVAYDVATAYDASATAYAYAAYDASYTDAYADAAAAAKKKNQKQTAAICRKVLTPFIESYLNK